MERHQLNQTQMAALLSVDKSTLSRSLSSSSFSSRLRLRAQKIAMSEQGETTEYVLHKSLYLLEQADRLRQEASRLIVEAIDRAARAG